MAYTYQRTNYGDYYQGDIFGSILGGIKKVAGVVGSVVPGPVGIAARAISGTPAGRQIPVATTLPLAPGLTLPQGGQVARVPGLTGMAQRLVPGGATGYMLVGKKRRRINPANPKALRRAIRRQTGFVKLARRALKGTGYTISTRKPARRAVSIHESGPGSVTVR